MDRRKQQRKVGKRHRITAFCVTWVGFSFYSDDYLHATPETCNGLTAFVIVATKANHQWRLFLCDLQDNIRRRLAPKSVGHKAQMEF